MGVAKASDTSPLGHYEERVWEPRPGAPGGRRNRKAFRYEVFFPVEIAERDFDFRGDVAAIVAEASTALAHLNSQPPKLQSLEALARQLLRAESLASSRIEGLELSHLRLARALHADGAAYDQRAGEVVGNIAATERAIELGAKAGEFAVRDIEEIHATLMRSAIDGRIAGRVRERQNWIGKSVYNPRNADYVPPPPEAVHRLLEDLCRFVERDDLPAVAQAAIAHAQFETIHPFWDGNGRVGRCLIHAVLRRRGAAPRFVPPVSLILAARRQRYIGGLEDYRAGRVDDWVEVFALTMQIATEQADRLADSVAGLQQRWLKRAGNPRADAAAHSIVTLLPAYPVLDVATVERLLGISDVAAGRALNRLEAAGVLTPIGDRRRDRRWECRELSELVTELEADLGSLEGF